jgi:3-hydroxyisobutyrate dehydrogenase-like beta-hydroxyacid dehydrogenase
MKKKIGFIGLGVMGANMCRRLLESGKFDLTVFDIEPAKVEEIVKLGASSAASIGDLAGKNSFIACSLPNPDGVKKVFLAAGTVIDHAKSGTVILDLSTVDSDTSKEVSGKLAEKGVVYIDTPVSGGKYDSLKGTLTLIIGAREEELAEHMDFLQTLSSSIHFAGTRGAGSTIKLVNNVMSMGNLLVAAEAFVLGVKAGVDGGTLFNIIQHCGGRSHRLTKRFPNILQGDFEPKFTVDLAEKDLTLALDLARKLKVPMLMAGLTHDFFLMTSKSGRGGSDATAIIQYLEELNGVEVRGEAKPDKRYI